MTVAEAPVLLGRLVVITESVAKVSTAKVVTIIPETVADFVVAARRDVDATDEASDVDFVED